MHGAVCNGFGYGGLDVRKHGELGIEVDAERGDRIARERLVLGQRIELKFQIVVCHTFIPVE